MQVAFFGHQLGKFLIIDGNICSKAEGEARGYKSPMSDQSQQLLWDTVWKLKHVRSMKRSQSLRSGGTYRNNGVACLLWCLFFSMWVELGQGEINRKCSVFHIFEAETWGGVLFSSKIFSLWTWIVQVYFHDVSALTAINYSRVIHFLTLTVQVLLILLLFQFHLTRKHFSPGRGVETGEVIFLRSPVWKEAATREAERPREGSLSFQIVAF